MNKAHFQTMFSSTSGVVYRFLGELPVNANPVAIITEQFITDSGENLMSTVVVEVPNQYILYTDSLEVVTSESFEFITDLTPDEVILPVVQPVEGQ